MGGYMSAHQPNIGYALRGQQGIYCDADLGCLDGKAEDKPDGHKI